MTPLEKLGHNPRFKKELKKAYRRIKISALIYKLKVKLFFWLADKPLINNLRYTKFFQEVFENEYFN